MVPQAHNSHGIFCCHRSLSATKNHENFTKIGFTHVLSQQFLFPLQFILLPPLSILFSHSSLRVNAFITMKETTGRINIYMRV